MLKFCVLADNGSRSRARLIDIQRERDDRAGKTDLINNELKNNSTTFIRRPSDD